MSDPNLVLKLLRKLDTDLQAFRGEVNERFARVETCLDSLEHAVGGMATHLFALTDIVRDHERRIRTLEAPPLK